MRRVLSRLVSRCARVFENWQYPFASTGQGSCLTRRTRFGQIPLTPVGRSALRLERLEDREVPATFYVTSEADSGSGTLREALETMNPNEYNQIFIQVGAIELNSQLYAYDTAEVEIIGDYNPLFPVLIRPAQELMGEFRFLTSGLANQGTTTLSNLDIRYFGTTGDGGAILNLGLQLNVDGCIISENMAAGNGGAIASTPGLQLNVTNSGFEYNTAGGNGGAVYFAPNGGVENLTIDGSGFMENTASGLGGAVYSVTLGTVYIRSQFSMNSAENGGAIYMMGGIQQVDMRPVSGGPGPGGGPGPITIPYFVTGNTSTGSGTTGAVVSAGAASVWIEGIIQANSSTYDVYILAPASWATVHVSIAGTVN